MDLVASRPRPRRLHRDDSRLRVGAIVLLAAFTTLAPGVRLAHAAPKAKSLEWYLERGRTNMEIGNYKAAIESYQKAAEINPDDREAMKQLGLAYEHQGLTTRAIEQFDRYLERFRDDPDIAFKQADYLGWSRFDYRRDDAIRYYRMGLEVREDTGRRHKLAKLLAKEREQVGDALEQYRKLLEEQPKNDEWRAEYRRLLLWDDRHLKEAIQEYRRYAKERGGDFEVQHTLAKLVARHDPASDEAVSLYADLLERKPGDAALRREYADLLSADPKRRSEAIEVWRALLERDGKPATRYQLARLLAQDRSRLDEALEQYRLLVKADPDNAAWRAEYRKLLLWDEDHLPEAVDEHRRLAAENPGDLDLQHTLAALLYRQDPESEEALSLYAELVSRQPKDAALRAEYADALARHPSRRADALQEYRASLEADPKPATRHKLARLLAREKDQLDEALAEYRRLLDEGPGNHTWRAEYRKLLLWDERYLGEAIEEHRQLAAARPDDIAVQHQLAQLLAREDPRSDEAVSLYQRLVAARPGDVAIRAEYADALASHPERRDDAIEEYRRVIGGDGRPATRHKLARLLAMERDQLDEALEHYRLIVAEQPNNAEWRAEYRKLLLWDDEHVEEAIEEYRQVAEEKPGDFTTHHTLARLLASEDPRSDEAAALYGDLVASRPDDEDLRLEYAGVLSADPGRRTDAIREYQLLLERKPRNAPVRKSLARLLAAREDSRDEALRQYQLLLREEPGDTDSRLRYARLLGSERDDTPEAIQEYEAIASNEPRNAAAHVGLAESYAWLRKRDRALHHSNLAVEYGARGSRIFALRRDLVRNQDPRLEAFARGIFQRGRSKSRLDGVAGGLAGRLDLGSALTLRAEGGGEDYWRPGENKGGAFGSLEGDIHVDADREIAIGGGYHTLGRRSAVGHLAYSRRIDDWTLSGGAERKLRYDSFVALVGDTVDGRRIGSARENRAHLAAHFQGERGEFRFEPYGGVVDADGVPGNPFGGALAKMGYRVVESSHFDLAPTLGLEAFHYRFDAFAVERGPNRPRPGGYFSPQLFAQGVPGLEIHARLSDSFFLDLEGGPAVQLVKVGSESAELDMGGQGSLEAVLFLHPSIYWKLGAEVASLGAAYTRIGASTSIAFEF